MPPVLAAALAAAIPSLGLTAITVGTLAVSYSTLVVNGALLLAGATQARRARRRAGAAFEATLKDRTVTLRSSDAARPIVYGRSRVGGTLAFAHTSGAQSQFLHMVAALADHEVDAIEDVWLADAPIAPLNVTVAASGANRLRDSRHVGARVGRAPSVTSPNLLANPTTLNAAPWAPGNVVVTSAGGGWWDIAKTTTGGSANLLQEFTRGRRMIRIEVRAGTSNVVSLGVYDGSNASFGTLASLSSGRIVSGPGVLTRSGGALFFATGLSPTVPTIIEVSRFDHANRIYIYPGGSGSTTLGASVQVRSAAAHAGDYGTLPTDASYVGPATTAIVGEGSEGGIPYLDVRLCGRGPASGAAAGFNTVTGSLGPVAASGQTWAQSAYVRRLTTATGVSATQIATQGFTTGGTYVEGQFTSINPTTAALSTQRFAAPRAMAGATVGRANGAVYVTAASGTWFDVTLRIGGLQLEPAATPTAFVPTPELPIAAEPGQGSRWFKFVTGGDVASEAYTVAAGGVVTLLRGAESILSIVTEQTTVNAEGSTEIRSVPCTFAYAPGSTSVTDIRVGGVLLAAGTPVIVTYPFSVSAARVRLRLHHGQAGQVADPDLVAESGGLWTATEVGTGVPYVYARLEFDADVFAAGIPNISAVVRGRRVFDPRTGLTAWSANPALCAADYLVNEVGCATSEVDWPSVTAAANVCDEQVPIDGGMFTQARYECNGVLSTESDLRENLEAILSSMLGSAVYSGGVWTLRAGAFSSPTITLDADDLADGAISGQARLARRDLFNAVRGRIIDPAVGYQLNDFPAYVSPTYIAEDNGQELYREIDLPMTDDPARSQRMAKLMLLQSRQALVFTATWNLSAYRLTPGDTVSVTLARYGWSAKVFRVIARTFNTATADVTLTMREESAAIYAWDFNEAANPDPAPNSTLPSPWFSARPTGLTATSGAATIERRGDGSTSPRIRASWNPMTDPGVLNGGALLLSWKRASDTVWSEEVRLPGADVEYFLRPVAAGDVFNIALRSENGLGARSGYTLLTHTVAANAGTNSSRAVDGVGVNLIANSQFLRESTGWAAQVSGTLASTASGRIAGSSFAPTYLLSGGGGFVMQETGVRPGNGVADFTLIANGQLVPVRPTELLEASVYMNTHRCSMSLIVAWYNAAGTYLNETVIAGPGEVAAVFNLQAISSWTRIGGFVQVPTGAAQAAIFARKFSTSSGSDSFLFLSRFFLGRAGVGQGTLSPWSEGGLRDVGTGSLLEGAATDVYSIVHGAAAIPSFTSTLAYGLSVPAPPVACTVVVSATLHGVIGWSGTGADNLTVSLRTNGGKITVAERLLAQASTELQTAVGSTGLSGEFTLAAGEAQTVQVWVTRSSTSAATSVGSVFIRAEVIKR